MKKYFSVNDKMAAYTDAVNSYYDGTISMMYAFVTSKNADNDTYTLTNMLKEDDRVMFIEAMLRELDNHNSRDYWKVMNRDKMPKNTKTIISIWKSFSLEAPDGYNCLSILRHLNSIHEFPMIS